MHSSNNQHNGEGRGMQITVQGGVHDGAHGILGTQQITVIGSASDCDLQLCDSGVAAHHLAIGRSDEQFVVRPMDGQCTVHGRRVPAGASAPVSCGDRIALHGTDVSLVTAEHYAHEPSVDNNAAIDECAAGEKRSDERPPGGWKLYSCAALVAIVIAFGSQQLLAKKLPPPDAITRVTTVLQTLDIADAVAISEEAGVLTLSGMLPDDATVALQSALKTLPNKVVNRTQSVSRLLEQVRSVFRTNGYHAELTYVADGAVRVTNLDGENPKIRQVAAHARSDVSVLRGLTFAPVVDANRSGKRLAVYSTDPDKRLTTIVDGNTAYVATTDGGRYFVGSVLPGGLVLRDISADGIQVDDNGEIHWLAL